jgi:hypothetical protein
VARAIQGSAAVMRGAASAFSWERIDEHASNGLPALTDRTSAPGRRLL